jgi:cyclase
MLKNRLIAVILIRDGQVVQSVKFKHTNAIHYDPIHAIYSFNRWAVDEIVVLNVSKNESSIDAFIETVERISSECFVPLAAGGWLRDVETGRKLLSKGADKLVVNTEAFRRPEYITELSKRFGNQCVVVSIDAKRGEDGKEYVCIHRGEELTDRLAVDWAKEAESRGAGELFVNSIDHDGNRQGYNIELIKSITSRASIPVIAMGGVLTWNHLSEGISKAGANAVAAANIFHYTEHSTKKAKKHLLSEGFKFRKE